MFEIGYKKGKIIRTKKISRTKVKYPFNIEDINITTNRVFLINQKRMYKALSNYPKRTTKIKMTKYQDNIIIDYYKGNIKLETKRLNFLNGIKNKNETPFNIVEIDIQDIKEILKFIIDELDDLFIIKRDKSKKNYVVFKKFNETLIYINDNIESIMKYLKIKYEV